jgi:hypothetical protein
MINGAVEHDNPKVPGGSVLELRLLPKPGEALEDFHRRIELLTHGVHQMDFKKLSEIEYRLAIELNPSWEEPEPEDFNTVDQAELLKELHATAASRTQNKIDYSEKG